MSKDRNMQRSLPHSLRRTTSRRPVRRSFATQRNLTGTQRESYYILGPVDNSFKHLRKTSAFSSALPIENRIPERIEKQNFTGYYRYSDIGHDSKFLIKYPPSKAREIWDLLLPQ
mmetsp:Transcript_101610/g.206419  ORF Transcript_101610/g.206419 Transcript_101610/m.206419 type:complete len:115 (+) Transcript_101610:172-516(+)